MVAGWVLLGCRCFGAAVRSGLYATAGRCIGTHRAAPDRLQLALVCSSWTFCAVGIAVASGWSLPIYLGPILLFVFGIGS